MVWHEIKGPCNQLEGGQMKWTISQMMHHHVLISLRSFIRSTCSHTRINVWLVSFKLLQQTGGYFLTRLENLSDYLSRESFNQHYQMPSITAMTYSCFKERTLLSESFKHFFWLISLFLPFVKRHSTMNCTHTHTHTYRSTHVDKHERSWVKLSQLPY